MFDCIRLWRMIVLSKSGPDITCKYSASICFSLRAGLILYTDNQAPVVLWTCVEAAVGIVAACLPNLRPLFRIGGSGFWSQIRYGSKGSGKSHLNTATTATTATTTTTTSTNLSLQKGPLDSHVAEEGIETHRYSDIVREKC